MVTFSVRKLNLFERRNFSVKTIAKFKFKVTIRLNEKKKHIRPHYVLRASKLCMPPNNYLFSNQFDRQIEVMPKIIHQYHVYFLASKKKMKTNHRAFLRVRIQRLKEAIKWPKIKQNANFVDDLPPIHHKTLFMIRVYCFRFCPF